MHSRNAAAIMLALGLMSAGPSATATGGGSWVDQFGTAQPEEAEGIAADPAGSVSVAGWTAGTLPGQSSAGTVDAFVRRYDRAGNVQWTRQFGSRERDFAREIALDGDGNVYVVGETEGVLPGMRSAGGRDAFVRKYDASGALLWTRQFGGGGGEGAWGVAVDPAGLVYVSGSTRAALPGHTPAGDWDGFLVKLTASGDEVWTRQFGTPYDDGTAAVAVDSAGRAWVTGSTGGAFPGHDAGGGYDGYVRLYDGDGSEVWTAQFGTAGDDFAVDIAVDGDGRASVAGSTDRAFPGHISAGGTDAFVRAFGAAGENLWLHQFGTVYSDDAWSVATDREGNVYVAGTTEERLPGQRRAGPSDVYVRMYDRSGAERWTEQFGGPDRDLVFGLALDEAGTPFVAGGTWGSMPGGRSAGARDAYAAEVG